MRNLAMSFTFRPMDEAGVHELTSWTYEPPYDIYNFHRPPNESDINYFLDPEYAYHAIIDRTGRISAFCSFGFDAQVAGGNYTSDALDIGLGIRPDLTGQGRGQTFVSAVLDFATATFSPQVFRVTIAEFNKRAMKVWQSAGFQAVQRFDRSGDRMPFVILTRSMKQESR